MSSVATIFFSPKSKNKIKFTHPDVKVRPLLDPDVVVDDGREGYPVLRQLPVGLGGDAVAAPARIPHGHPDLAARATGRGAEVHLEIVIQNKLIFFW